MESAKKTAEAVTEMANAKLGGIALIGAFCLLGLTLWAGYDVGNEFVRAMHEANRINKDFVGMENQRVKSIQDFADGINRLVDEEMKASEIQIQLIRQLIDTTRSQAEANREIVKTLQGMR